MVLASLLRLVNTFFLDVVMITLLFNLYILHWCYISFLPLNFDNILSLNQNFQMYIHYLILKLFVK